MNIVENRETIGIILGLLLPGAGHIYLGCRDKGIKIAISFVIVSILFLNILSNSFFPLFHGGIPFVFLNIFQGLMFIPPFIIWYRQIRDLQKIINQQG